MMVQRTEEGNIATATDSLNSVAGNFPPYNVNVTNWPVFPTYLNQIYSSGLTLSWSSYSSTTAYYYNGIAGGFSKMFVYIQLVSVSPSSSTETLWISSLIWSLSTSGPYAFEPISENFANITFSSPSMGSLYGPYEFDVEGPIYNFGFNIVSNAPSGSVTINVYAYLRYY
jgi:hypothetical protein